VCAGSIEKPSEDEDTWADTGNESDTDCLSEEETLKESNPPTSLRNVSAVCRERLATITSHTYVCEDVTVLSHVAELLFDVEQYLDKHLVKDNGLNLDAQHNSSQLKKIYRAEDKK